MMLLYLGDAIQAISALPPADQYIRLLGLRAGLLQQRGRSKEDITRLCDFADQGESWRSYITKEAFESDWSEARTIRHRHRDTQ